MDQLKIFKALGNESRLLILKWLKEPAKYFPEEVSSQNSYIGICVGDIQKKLGITQSTTSQYLNILQDAGLLTVTRRGKWTYYRRNEQAFQDLAEYIANKL